MAKRLSYVPYDPAGGGLLRTGNRYARVESRVRRQQQRKGLDRMHKPFAERERDPEVPEYVEGRRYSRKQLCLMADDILRKDPKDIQEYPVILFEEHLKERHRREIYNVNGIPDPSIVQGMYWRAHPEGRKVQSNEMRAKGASYYR